MKMKYIFFIHGLKSEKREFIFKQIKMEVKR